MRGENVHPSFIINTLNEVQAIEKARNERAKLPAVDGSDSSQIGTLKYASSEATTRLSPRQHGRHPLLGDVASWVIDAIAVSTLIQVRSPEVPQSPPEVPRRSPKGPQSVVEMSQ